VTGAALLRSMAPPVTQGDTVPVRVLNHAQTPGPRAAYCSATSRGLLLALLLCRALLVHRCVREAHETTAGRGAMPMPVACFSAPGTAARRRRESSEQSGAGARRTTLLAKGKTGTGGV
jgi:hypothetical protein